MEVDEAAIVDGILDSMEDIGRVCYYCSSRVAASLRHVSPTSRYAGPLLEEGGLTTAARDGLSSQPFTDLIVALSSQLKSTLGLSEAITPPQG